MAKQLIDIDSEALDTVGAGGEQIPRSPLRVMQVLRELAKTSDGMQLARLRDRLDLPKTTLLSLLRALESGNFIRYDNGRYRLGQGTFQLASSVSRYDNLAARFQHNMEELQRQTRETVVLGVPSADWSNVVFAGTVEAASPLRVVARVGAERPIYSSAVGVALLAWATADQQTNYIANTKFVKNTPTTPTSAKALRDVLNRTRKQGYIVSSAAEPGVTAIAAPALGPRGEIVSAVAICGPTSRMEDHEKEFVELIVETSQRMSKMLGFTGTIEED